MKRFLAFLIVAMTVLGLSAQTKKAVVAYFSATGTTEAVAKQLAKEKKAVSGIEQSVSELKTTYPSVKWQKGMLKN